MSNHMDWISSVSEQDVKTLIHKERTYGGSWKKRGGVGAFMMLARKMDRIEVIAEQAAYDIFAVIKNDGLNGADGELLAEIRDLRCYLLLVEAEMTVRLENEVEHGEEEQEPRPTTDGLPTPSDRLGGPDKAPQPLWGRSGSSRHRDQGRRSET